jgi:hypothetical protein
MYKEERGNIFPIIKMEAEIKEINEWKKIKKDSLHTRYSLLDFLLPLFLFPLDVEESR